MGVETKPTTPKEEPFIPSILIEDGRGRVTVTDLMKATRVDDIYNMFSQHSKTHPDTPVHIVLDRSDIELVFDEPWLTSSKRKPATKAGLRNGSLNPIITIRVENIYADTSKEGTEVLKTEKGTEVVVLAKHDTAPPSIITFERIITPISSPQ